ncbi:hypothetical protein ACLOJK_038260 [Asimina triloba]
MVATGMSLDQMIQATHLAVRQPLTPLPSAYCHMIVRPQPPTTMGASASPSSTPPSTHRQHQCRHRPSTARTFLPFTLARRWQVGNVGIGMT